ncbi:MAG: hypothetical protein ACE5GL_11535 [Calditrichia bacterium]
MSAGATYARSLSKKMDGGITVKYLFEKIHINDASGIAVDFGLRYKLTEKNLYIAATVQNLGTMGELENESTKLPALARLGMMYSIPKNIGPANILLALDLVKPLEENLRFNTGGEFTFWKQLALRAGYMGGYESRSVTFGLGIRKSTFRFDYSLTPFKNGLETGHHFSVNIGL